MRENDEPGSPRDVQPHSRPAPRPHGSPAPSAMNSAYYGWVIVAITVLMQAFSLGIFLYSFGVVLIPWTQSFQASRAELTMIPVAIQVITGIASPFVGHFIDRLPPKPAILIGIGVTLVLGSAQLGGVIAAAMLTNIVIAGLAGVLVPLGLERAGADPAVASSVFVTMVTDSMGFLVFLGLASGAGLAAI